MASLFTQALFSLFPSRSVKLVDVRDPNSQLSVPSTQCNNNARTHYYLWQRPSVLARTGVPGPGVYGVIFHHLNANGTLFMMALAQTSPMLAR